MLIKVKVKDYYGDGEFIHSYIEADDVQVILPDQEKDGIYKSKVYFKGHEGYRTFYEKPDELAKKVMEAQEKSKKLSTEHKAELSKEFATAIVKELKSNKTAMSQVTRVIRTNGMDK